jgi:hypothetical protein
MWWPNLDWKRNLATDNRPTIDVNLIWNQSICLNASITLSKLPIMMQAQIWATNMRWRGTTLKSLQPCLVPMSNTTIGHSWLSHYNCQTEMWWPILDWKRNLTRNIHPTIDLNLMWNKSICFNASITQSKLPIMMKHKSEQPIWDAEDDLKKFANLSCANVQYNYWPQLTLTL